MGSPLPAARCAQRSRLEGGGSRTAICPTRSVIVISRANGNEVFDRLGERVRSGRFPMMVHRFPLPKAGQGGVRALSWLDEYDGRVQGVRVLVGRLAPAIAARCDPEVVFSYPLERRPPGWSTESHRGPLRP